MPLFSSTSSSSSAKPSADGSFEAPTRHDRIRCWEARDAFFACLDAHGIIDSIKDSESASKACGKFDVQLQKDCAGSWVTYFKQRRVMEYKKKNMLEELKKEGAQEMPGVAAAGPAGTIGGLRSGGSGGG
ncbi:MAG: hypothetical protein GOMPHAMPRED_001291 [Gomphillus americanus]|uniref:Uncharacterized protein n=1 Tax=Gomphillus americanus TaxID=1940652 RepID=A0A8H3F3I9_9LECA|nr:MAG: hypothetical protein GOMPHAMPRED_001291 [Gomphillus americanus]